MLLSKRTMTWIAGPVVFLAAVFGGLAYWAHRLEQKNAAYELVIHGNPSEAQLVDFLDSNYAVLVSNTLTALERRKLVGGREKAAKLLTSRDPQIWHPASLYLGAIGDQRSVPYLIRGLTHPAWRSRKRLLNHLQHLTGQSYGEGKEDWIKWWLAQNNAEFDFSCVTTQEWRNPVRQN
jgi:hypothetical protein